MEDVTMTAQVDFHALEEKWRPYWQQIGLYATEEAPGRKKHYILDFFPYPSGAGLSVGHCRNYVPTCVAARYLRMTGHNVLHPMGWDAFGLPAENYAINHGVHPAISSRAHADNYRRQLQLIECSYDWSREINSTDPSYYRWTQWIFLLLYQRGLAYRAEAQQWWCPNCKTILANEQVEGGRCWRCGTAVARKTLPQWYLRITDYAERLVDDLELVDWPESIVAMQRNWIGRSEGADVQFAVEGSDEQITVFTTRPDTLAGVTFLALAPEHPLVESVAAPEARDAVAAFIAEAARESDVERQAMAKGPAGVFSGRYAVHPLSGARLPIWVANYVVGGYGTGAIMGVPAHDERDQAFASRYELPQPVVIQPPEPVDGCYTGEGTLVNSGPYDGLASEEARAAIVAELEARGRGQAAVRYRLRDWLISRQRYWGTPIPIVHCAQCGIVPLPESALPLELPPLDDFAPAGDGRSPLARVGAWVNTTCPGCRGPAQRETDTIDGTACSSWYFLRFASPHETDRPFDPEAVAYWLPVDTYVGGAEHAVSHLLYARFWTKVLHDAGLVPFVEPFARLRNQGVLHAPDGRRMSKSRGNVITPDEVVAEHGVDALRTYVVFIAPFEARVTWDESGIRGVTRFLSRFYALAHDVASGSIGQDGAPAAMDLERRRHAVVARITDEMEAFKYNTAVAGLMGWLNELEAARERAVAPGQWRELMATFAVLLAPFAPFVTEEVWQALLGNEGSVHRQPWPTYDPALLVSEEVTLAVQVNGRLRDTIRVPAGADDALVEAAALAQPNVQAHVGSQRVQRIIVVPGRIVNVVTA
jgi:leucyl-tRNA synthetase